MPPAQLPILTVTLNPALDVTTATPTVTPGPKLRCTAPQVDPGGGGLNVSRAILRIGGDSTALLALGGATGQQLARLMQAEGLGHLPLDAPGDTRQSLTVNEGTTGRQFRFVLPGPRWSARDVTDALNRIATAAPKGGFVVLSGSQPPGFTDDFALMLARALAGKSLLLADTSGASLAQIAGQDRADLAVLRMDSEEAEALCGRALPTRRDTADLAADLVARGVAATVIIARGADGSVLATAAGRWFSQAAKVPVQSKVGAGDSFVAGYVLARARALPEPQALARGVAAASAAVMTPATELCRGEDAERLVADCPVSPI